MGLDLFAEDDSDPRAFVWEKTPTILALLVTEIIWLAIVFFITHNPETHEIPLTLFRIIRLIPISTLTASLLYPALFLPTPPPSNSLREESASLLHPSSSPIPPPIPTPSQEPYIRRRSDSPTRSLADSLRSPTRSIESVDLFYDAIETHSREPSMFTAAETMSVDSERRRRKWTVQKELKGLEVGVA
ncbi:hypothetical protein BCR33DRAFT_338856 [Rhizoclosmatium globosum]|uniref:Uncharacterized protein n=1 Tax=Rhizoclosmatium globosum TaxID=329046 RepID=A0A1Y1ZZE6_9FUNG|nr:hypothetical protein BCR33DRAFT_338856 [Rhizoclosmatium globosum]|eukprot:ORY15653.1 hypothetical protein BCR33DRAFT_338856 [Rhizoclosmatium globosum]